MSCVKMFAANCMRSRGVVSGVVGTLIENCSYKIVTHCNEVNGYSKLAVDMNFVRTRSPEQEGESLCLFCSKTSLVALRTERYLENFGITVVGSGSKTRSVGILMR